MSDSTAEPTQTPKERTVSERDNRNVFSVAGAAPRMDEKVAERTTVTAPAAEKPSFRGKLIVSVHGMGDQTRNDFTQIIARLFARYYALKDKNGYQAKLLPIGAWDGGRETD